MNGKKEAEHGLRMAERLGAIRARPILVVSHRRSGTHLTIDLLRRHFGSCRILKRLGETTSHVYLPLDALYSGSASVTDEEALRIVERAPRPIVKAHSVCDDLPAGTVTCRGRLGAYWIDWIEQNPTVIYVYRDGRDVLASMHLYMQSFDASTRVPFSQFIRQRDRFGHEHLGQGSEPSRPGAWSRHVRRGLSQPHVLALSYESIVAETEHAILRLGQALGEEPEFAQPLLPRKLRSIWQMRWHRCFSRSPESTAILGTHRRAEGRGWHPQMSEADRRFFHAEAGEMLAQLGYETSDAWVSSAIDRDRARGVGLR